jgi:hypothetical protein
MDKTPNTPKDYPDNLYAGRQTINKTKYISAPPATKQTPNHVLTYSLQTNIFRPSALSTYM